MLKLSSRGDCLKNGKEVARELTDYLGFEKVSVNVNKSKTQIGREAPYLESADFVCITTPRPINSLKSPSFSFTLFQTAFHFAGQTQSIFYTRRE